MEATTLHNLNNQLQDATEQALAYGPLGGNEAPPQTPEPADCGKYKSFNLKELENGIQAVQTTIESRQMSLSTLQALKADMQAEYNCRQGNQGMGS